MGGSVADACWLKHIFYAKTKLSLFPYIPLLVWWFGTWILWLSIQLGISSSQLTNSIIFQRGVGIPPLIMVINHGNPIKIPYIYIYIYQSIGVLILYPSISPSRWGAQSSWPDACAGTTRTGGGRGVLVDRIASHGGTELGEYGWSYWC